MKSASGLEPSAEENWRSRSSRILADWSSMIWRSWCCTAAVEPSPNRRCSSLARCPSSAPKTSSTLVPKNSATTRALSVNAVSTSRETFSNSLRTNSASTADCSRSSTRAPISIASITTCVGVLARLHAAVQERRGGGIVDDDVLDDHPPHEDVDAGLAEGRGGFHGERLTVRAAPDRTAQRDAEAREPLGLLLVHVDARHVGVPRAAAHELDQRVDGLRRALEDGLDRALGGVARPAGHAAALGLPARRVAEEDSLHMTVSDHSAAGAGHADTVEK